MPGLKMPQLRLRRPIVIRPGEAGYEDFKWAVQAKFNHYDEDKQGVLGDREAVHLAVDMYTALHPTKHLSFEEAKELAAKLLKRVGRKAEGKIDFEEFLEWYTVLGDKLQKMDDAHGLMDPKDRHVSGWKRGWVGWVVLVDGMWVRAHGWGAEGDSGWTGGRWCQRSSIITIRTATGTWTRRRWPRWRRTFTRRSTRAQVGGGTWEEDVQDVRRVGVVVGVRSRVW